jgi:CDP-diacylglycerol--glycerol-3-phosphate 3-phosphatidyltransferase
MSPEPAASTSAPAPAAAPARPSRRTLAQDALNIPNLLTMGRVVAIPFFVWLLDTPTPVRGFWACIVFTLAAITDLLDGYLARKLGVVSVLGKFLDPLADKLIVMAALVWMVPMGRMPAWAVVLLLARELSVTGLRSVAASEGVVISAGNEGKTKTALQMIGIIALVLGYPYHLSYAGLDLGVVDLVHVGRTLVYLSLLFSFASAAQYVRLFAEAVEAKEKRRDASA